MKTLRWFVPTLIVLAAMTLSVTLTLVLDISEPGLSFLLGMMLGSLGGVVALFAWNYFDSKINGW